MYNEEIKNRFIDELQPDSIKAIYTSLFRRTADYEKQLDKDIFNFNLNDCLGVVIMLNPKSVTGVGIYKSQFNKYTEWAIEENIKETTSNYWTLVPINDDYAKNSFYFRYVKDIEELINIVDIGLSSKYDKYVVYLLYMGIMGTDCEEITLIKDSDIRVQQGMIITKRRIYSNIIKPLYDLITKGEYFEDSKKRDDNSEYFVKPFATKKLMGNPVNMHYIYRIFDKLNDNYNEAIKTDDTKQRKILTPMTVWRSGLFYSLYELEQKKGNELSTDDFKEQFEIFGKDIKEIGKFPREYKLYKDVFWH